MIASTEFLNFYNMTEDNMVTVLDFLKAQKIQLVILRLNAFSEGLTGSSPGDYDSLGVVFTNVNGVAPAIRFINLANTYGIDVAIDLHTWYTTWDNNFRDAASNHDANRAKYITYVKNVLTAFAGSNVYAFMVMNEPQARMASDSENQFILDVIIAAKSVTNKPVSVRFMGTASPTTGDYASEIDDACNFICRNMYWVSGGYYDPRNYNEAVENIMLDALDSAHLAGKQCWITEFGRVKSNLEVQRSYVATIVSWASQKGFDAVFCWASQPSQSGENYNIWTGYVPHPAFYELVSGVVPPPPPEPEPEPPVQPGCIIAFLLTSAGLSTALPFLRQFRSHLPKRTVKTYYGLSKILMEGVRKC